jgi:hypothetical protein
MYKAGKNIWDGHIWWKIGKGTKGSTRIKQANTKALIYPLLTGDKKEDRVMSCLLITSRALLYVHKF